MLQVTLTVACKRNSSLLAFLKMFSKSDTNRLAQSKIPRPSNPPEPVLKPIDLFQSTYKTPSKPISEPKFIKKVTFSAAKKPSRLGTPLRVLPIRNEAQTPLERSKILGTPIRVKVKAKVD